MLRLCFGAEPEAQAVVARINAIHERVHGQLPEAAGIFPAGTSYSARDPALLAWVHATLLDMNLRVYERFVSSLSLEEKDRYCVEASAIEEHFAIPAGLLPRSVSQLQQYMDTMLGSGEIKRHRRRERRWRARSSILRRPASPRLPSGSCAASPSACCPRRSGPIMASPGVRGTRPCSGCRRRSSARSGR